MPQRVATPAVAATLQRCSGQRRRFVVAVAVVVVVVVVVAVALRCVCCLLLVGRSCGEATTVLLVGGERAGEGFGWDVGRSVSQKSEVEVVGMTGGGCSRFSATRW